jgi:hypothetical protein
VVEVVVDVVVVALVVFVVLVVFGGGPVVVVVEDGTTGACDVEPAPSEFAGCPSSPVPPVPAWMGLPQRD